MATPNVHDLKNDASADAGVDLTMATTATLDGNAAVGVVGCSAIVTLAGTAATTVSTSNPLPIGDAGGSLTVDNAGTFVIQEDGAALTALQLIDDVVYVDDADWTATSSKHALIGGVYQSTPGTITDGDVGPLRVTANGAAHVAVQNSVTVTATQLDIDNLNKDDDEVLFWANTAKDGTGTDYVPLVDADGHLQVDILSGGGGGTQFAVDDALGATPTGTLAVAIRDDALSSLTPIEGDAVGLRVDANGALWTIPSGTVTVTDDGSFTLAANDGVDIGDVTINNASIAVTSAAALDVSAATVTVDSELPAAAALADNTANPTVPGVGSFAMVWDGSTWDRMPGTSTDGVTVNLGTNNDVTLATLPDTAASDLATINSNTDSLAVVGGGTEATAVRVTIANDSTGVISIDDNSGSITVDAAELTAIQTAVQVIDNSVFVDDAAFTLTSSSVNVAGAIRDNTLSTLAAAEADAVPLRVSGTGALWVSNDDAAGRYDIFGRAITATPNNDIDVQFFRAAPENLVKVTTANSATATQNVGGALFASSTNANGSVQGVSQGRTVYRSGSEIYAMFTASFTAGIANSYMRIGLYDANNGFFIGYEGTTFGITVRNNAVDAAQVTSFSDDALDGGAASRFTRNGSPEAIDLTKLNVYRIRFGWLGSAPVLWEVMAPDGHWVTFHRTLFPNLQAAPSIRDSDLPITLDITKTAAAATDLQIQTDCWGGGATLVEQSGIIDQQNSRFASTLSAGTSWNAAGAWVDIHRYSITKVLIYSSTSNASGTLYADFSMDGSTVHRTIQYDVADAASEPPHTLIPVAQFLRIRYTADAGGGNDHANFTVQTIHSVNGNKLPTSRVTTTITNDTDVDNVRAVIAGENPSAGGSYVNVRVNASGQLQADIAADSVGLATEATVGSIQTAVETIDNAIFVDDAAFTVTSSSVAAVGYMADETTPDSVDEGDIGIPRMTLTRKPYAVITDPTSENNAAVDGSGHLQVDIAASSATVTVDGSGVTQPVSGTITANLSATDNAVLDDIAAWTSNPVVATDDTTTHTAATTKVLGIGAVATPTDTNVDANDIGMPAMSLDRRLHVDAQIVGTDAALDVSGATVTVDLGSNNDVQGVVAEGAAVTGTNPFLIAGDDGTNVKHVAVASDGAIHVDDGGNSLTVDATQLDVDDLAATADNVGAALMTNVIHDGTTALTPKFAKIDAATSGDNTLVAAVAGKKIRVLQAFLVSTGDVLARFEDGAGGTALTGQMDLAVNSGFVLPFSPVGWFETTANTLLNLELDGAVSVDGCLVYVEV